MRAAVNVFDTLAAENAVSDVTGRRVATSASPAVPRQVEPSANRMAAEIPGMPYFARRRSSRASRTARRIGVARGMPRRGGLDPFAELAGLAGGVTPAAVDGVGPVDGDEDRLGVTGTVDATAAGEGSAGEVAAGEGSAGEVAAGAPRSGDRSQLPTTITATARASSGRRTARITGTDSAT